MTAVVRRGRCGGGIIVGDDKGKFGDKVEDVESIDGVGSKDRDDIGKDFSHEGKIVDKCKRINLVAYTNSSKVDLVGCSAWTKES